MSCDSRCLKPVALSVGRNTIVHSMFQGPGDMVTFDCLTYWSFSEVRKKHCCIIVPCALTAIVLCVAFSIWFMYSLWAFAYSYDEVTNRMQTALEDFENNGRAYANV